MAYKTIILEQGKKQKNISETVKKAISILYKIEAGNFMMTDELVKEVSNNDPMSIRSAILLMKCESLIEENGLGEYKIIQLTKKGKIFARQHKLNT